MLSERVWYALQPSVFCETGVVGCIDDAEGEALNISEIVFCETELVGCIDTVEGEALNNGVTELRVTDVVCGITDVDTLEDSNPGSDGL